MMMLEKEEMQPGAAPAAFPSPIFVGSDSVSWFLCFSASSSPPLEIASGGLYIVSFRSRRTSGDQDGRLTNFGRRMEGLRNQNQHLAPLSLMANGARVA